MSGSALRYRTLFAARGVPSVLISSLIGQLPIGMGMLLFILVVHAGTGSYTIGGLAAAANSLATAIFSPPLGRLADRGHAALTLIVTGILEAAALVGLVVVLKLGSDAAVIVGISALAGAVNPPISAVGRTVLPRLAPDKATATTALALDALLVELTYVIGTAIVGLVTAIWSGYVAAIVAAAFSLIGAFGLASTRSVRHGYARADAAPAPDRSRWSRLIGPLASSGVRTVLVVSTMQASAFGVLEVAIPAYTNAHGMPQAGGLLFAVWSGGSIVGGIFYGGRDFAAPLPRQYSILMALNVVGFSSLLLASGVYTLGIFLFFAGLFIAPATTVEGVLVTRLAPAEAMTEAFTWSSTAIYLGFAIGSGIGAIALSSSLGDSSALTSATLIAIGLAAAGTLLTVIGQRSLRPATQN